LNQENISHSTAAKCGRERHTKAVGDEKAGAQPDIWRLGGQSAAAARILATGVENLAVRRRSGFWEKKSSGLSLDRASANAEIFGLEFAGKQEFALRTFNRPFVFARLQD
jgi:hypothetical protein